jgi:hypothetical protein
MQPQAQVIQLFLTAVLEQSPIPPDLALAVLSLDPQHQQVLQVRLLELMQQSPDQVQDSNPALAVLNQMGSLRLKDGRKIQELLSSLEADKRAALWEKGVKAGLLPLPPQAEPVLNPTPGLQADLNSVAARDKKLRAAQETADLKAGLALAGKSSLGR